MPTDSEQSGYIKLHRELVDSKLWSMSEATFKVGIYLMLMANHKPRPYRGVDIERGQCIRSLSRISTDCALSRKACRYALTALKRCGFLTSIKAQGRGGPHMITICNYDSYQGEGHKKGTKGAQEGTQKGTTNKNDKNEKNDKKYKHGEFQNVKLTDEEFQKLLSKQGEMRLKSGIEVLGDYMQSKGKRYASHYAVLKETSWVWQRVDDQLGSRRSVSRRDPENVRDITDVPAGLGVGA